MSDSDVWTHTVNTLLDQLSTGLELSKLHAAVAKGNIPLVQKLVRTGADVNGLDLQPQIMPLLVAVAARNIRMAQELIHLGADVNLKTSDRMTALFFAVVRGEVEIVKLLLDNGADINAKVGDANSLLYTAATYNHAQVGELLIERGMDVNVRGCQDETPLHNAVQSGSTEFVKMLITKGADVNAGSCTKSPLPERGDPLGTNVTPIYLAAAFNFSAVIDILIKAGANVNATTSGKHSPLHAAAQRGSVKSVNKLLAAGSNVNAETQLGHTPLLFAAGSGHTEVVEALLRVDGIKVDPLRGESLETPLTLAAANNHLKIVKLLVAKGASVNARDARGMSPLNAAIVGEDEKVIKFLIDSGANINEKALRKFTPLHCVCSSEAPLNLVKLLLEEGADVHSKSEDGSTPFLSAADTGSVEMMKCLIAHGADPNTSNDSNVTGLHVAAKEGNVKAVEFLISKNVNVNAVMTGALLTPLHYAVIYGHPGTVEILLKSGADPNARDVKQCSALHLAAVEKQYEIAELLLKYRADVNLREGEKGSTALLIALENKHEKLAHLLLDNGADPNLASKWNVMPIFVAYCLDSVEMVRALLAKGAYYKEIVVVKQPANATTPVKLEQNIRIKSMQKLIDELFSSVIKNNMYQLGCCVKAGAIINARDTSGRTALHYAGNNGNTEAVHLLLRNGADISYATDKGNSPLHFAVAKQLIDVVEILLAHSKSLSFVMQNSVINAKTTKHGTTVLHTAAEKNNAPIVKLLLTNGAIYNAKNISNKTPSQLTTDEAIKRLFSSAENLFQAVKKEDGLEEVTRILEEDGIEINVRDAGGATALYWSVSKGYTDIVDALLSNKADYLLVTNKGTTPLHIAASKGNLKVVQTLVTRVKVDNPSKATDFIDATTVSGTAALHVASNVDVVKCLLQAGATYNICNGKYKTMLELTQDDSIRTLLQNTHQVFEDVRKGMSKVMNTLNDLPVDDFRAVTRTRNEKGQTLLEVALAGAPNLT